MRGSMRRTFTLQIGRLDWDYNLKKPSSRPPWFEFLIDLNLFISCALMITLKKKTFKFKLLWRQQKQETRTLKLPTSHQLYARFFCRGRDEVLSSVWQPCKCWSTGMFHKPKQMEMTGPSLSLSRNMTSPHMVPVIDQSLESDGQGGRMRTEQARSHNIFHRRKPTCRPCFHTPDPLSLFWAEMRFINYSLIMSLYKY